MLLTGLSVVIAAVGQFYLSNNISLLDGLVFYSIACLLFERGTRGALSSAETEPGDAAVVRTEVNLIRGKYIAVVLLGIFLIALSLRFYQLSSIPYGLWFDEAAIGLEAARVQSDSGYRPMYSTGTTSPPAYMYIVAAFQKIFGQNVTVLRSVSALFGALTVVPFYFLVTLLFGPSTTLSPRRAGAASGSPLAPFGDRTIQLVGLLGAFLLAVSRWHINFSRIAMQGVTTPFFATLVIVLLLLAIRTRKTAWFLASGVCLGLGIWFYSSFLLFPLVIGAYLFRSVLHPPSSVRATWSSIAIFVLAAFLAAAPVFFYAVKNPDVFFYRISAASAFETCSEPCGGEGDALAQLLTILQSARKHILMFNYEGDRNGRHNIPGEPMLDPFTGVLAVLGLAFAVSRTRGAKSVLLLVWLAVMLAPGILSLPFEAPQGLRVIGAIPAAYLLAALATKALINAYGRVLRFRQVQAGLVVLALLVGTTNVVKYFTVQANSYPSWASFSIAEALIAKRMAGLSPRDYVVSVSPLYYGHQSIGYIVGDRPYSMFDLSNGLPILPTSRDTAVFLSPDEKVARELIRDYYPKSACEELTSPDRGPPVVVECLIKQEHVLDSLGLSVSYFPIGGTAPLLVTKESGLEISPAGGLRDSYRKEWSGSLYVPEYDDYEFSYKGSPAPDLFIDGDRVLGEGDDTARLRLAKGLHNIYASAVVTAPLDRSDKSPEATRPGDLTSAISVHWQRKGGIWEAIPQDYLFSGKVQAQGLVGRYYHGPDWGGQPAFERVDPAVSFYFHILSLERPYSVEWKGSVYAEAGGAYGFGLRSVGPSQLYIDGTLVVDAQKDDQLSEGLAALTPGWRQIAVRFSDTKAYSRIYVYWTPPGKGMEIVPPGYFRPW